MKINDSKIRKKVASYLQSDEFQKDFNANRQLTENLSRSWTTEEIRAEIHLLKLLLLEGAQDLTQRRSDTPSLANTRQDTSRFGGIKNPDGLLSHRVTNIVKDPMDKRKIISCKVSLYFNPDWVRSPSLNPDNPGVDNLLRLLTNGWDFRGDSIRPPVPGGLYKGFPRGTWYSGASARGKGKPIHNVFAQTYREPSGYLFNAVGRYNDKKSNNNIYAYMDSSYVNVFGRKTKNLIKTVREYGGGRFPIYDLRIRGIGTIIFGRR